jgi:hypothetical protein
MCEANSLIRGAQALRGEFRPENISDSDALSLQGSVMTATIEELY